MSDGSAEPLIGEVDPLGPDFQSWLSEQQQREIEALRAEAASLMPPAPSPDSSRGGAAGARTAAARRPRDPGGVVEPDGGSGGGGGTSTAPATPLASFFAYLNTRPDKDWNTCGQAAVASMVDFYGGDLRLPRGFDGHWDHGDAIDKVISAGYGPDVVFGWGTSPGRIEAALKHFGIAAEGRSSGLFFSGWTSEWNRLLAYVYYSAIPVPVLVDMGPLGGPPFGAHWPILWKMEYSSSGMLLHLANWDSHWDSLPIPSERFLEGWACRHLPLGYNHAAVYTGRPRISF